MKCELINAAISNLAYLENAKLNSILDYANNLSNSEISEIKTYVKNNTFKDINDYKLITFNQKIIGCLLVKTDNDNAILDEIYIEEEYRSKGIGTLIIDNVISKYKSTLLWVYKNNNKAISLYKYLGFIVIDETENRYHMEYTNINF